MNESKQNHGNSFADIRLGIVEAQLEAIHSSIFWKISAPLRVLLRILDLSSKKSRSTYSRSLHSEVHSERKINSILGHEVVLKNFKKIPNNKFAVLAHYSPEKTIDSSTKNLIKELIESGFGVILSSANQDLKFDLNEFQKFEMLAVITKPNKGYDFGSWLSAFHVFEFITYADELILTNSSCYGPFISLEDTIKKLADSKFTITSLTDCQKYNYHLQSYFIHLKNKDIPTGLIHEFISNLPLLESKQNLITQYEIGFTYHMQENNLKCGAIFPWNEFVMPWQNPTIEGAAELIVENFPFFKKEARRLLSGTQLAKIKLNLLQMNPEIDQDLLNQFN